MISIVDINLSQITASPLQKAEMAARICYDSEMSTDASKVDAFLIDKMLLGHFSVFEHDAIRAEALGSFVTELDKLIGVKKLPELELIKAHVRQGFVTMRDILLVSKHGDGLDREAASRHLDVMKKLETRALFKDYATFKIKCSRGISAEFNRHRTLAPNERSTRFCDGVKKGISFCRPVTEWANDPESKAYTLWYGACEHAAAVYIELRGIGVLPEDARGVLGLDLATDLMLSGTHYWWREFIAKRMVPNAHRQAISLANMIAANIPRPFDHISDTKSLERALKKIGCA